MTVQEGIYLETTQGKIGIGDTASQITYRNYYALREAGTKVELLLLDDNMELTGLRETVSESEAKKRFEYQPQLAERFQELMRQINPPAAPPAKRPAPQPPQARPASQAPQTRPAAPPPSKHTPAQPPQDQGQARAPGQGQGSPLVGIDIKGCGEPLQKEIVKPYPPIMLR